MAFDNAQSFTALGMAFPLAKQVGEAIDNSTANNPAITAIVALTNSTGGTANDTVQAVPQATAAVTDTTAASLTSTNAALTIINNDMADLTVKVNAILAALKA
jgi:hypothetical protein